MEAIDARLSIRRNMRMLYMAVSNRQSPRACQPSHLMAYGKDDITRRTNAAQVIFIPGPEEITIPRGVDPDTWVGFVGEDECEACPSRLTISSFRSFVLLMMEAHIDTPMRMDNDPKTLNAHDMVNVICVFTMPLNI